MCDMKTSWPTPLIAHKTSITALQLFGSSTLITSLLVRSYSLPVWAITSCARRPAACVSQSHDNKWDKKVKPHFWSSCHHQQRTSPHYSRIYNECVVSINQAGLTQTYQALSMFSRQLVPTVFRPTFQNAQTVQLPLTLWNMSVSPDFDRVLPEQHGCVVSLTNCPHRLSGADVQRCCLWACV